MNKQIIVIRNFIVNVIKKFGIREKILLNSNINKQILLKSIVELEKDDG